MLSNLLPAGTRLYMESPRGARLSGITLTYGHWEEPRFTFPDSPGLKGRESIGEYHMLGYYQRYVEPSERRRRGCPKDYLFVAEGQYAGHSLSAVDCLAIEEAPLPAATPACVAEPPPCVAEPPPCVASPPPCAASPPAPAPMSAVAAALERIRVREAELLAELEDLEQVRAAKERLAALESRVAAARAVLNSV